MHVHDPVQDQFSSTATEDPNSIFIYRETPYGETSPHRRRQIEEAHQKRKKKTKAAKEAK